uniref:Uncharacterized protein n=1 Tax=Nothobranchius korthausae TaxID=1143690 RepID=A0A1A8GRD7_9TELE
MQDLSRSFYEDKPGIVLFQHITGVATEEELHNGPRSFSPSNRILIRESTAVRGATYWCLSVSSINAAANQASFGYECAACRQTHGAGRPIIMSHSFPVWPAITQSRHWVLHD